MGKKKALYPPKLTDAHNELILDIVRLHHRAHQLGWYKTGHKLHEAVQTVGWEKASSLEAYQ